MKRYYVYSHKEINKNLPFYIGMAECKEKGFRYSRAYRPIGHSKQFVWNDYASSVSYDIKIEKEFNSLKEAEEYEIKLIKFYGRKDLGLGPLVNLTDGGMGLRNPSKILQNKIDVNKKAVVNTFNLQRGQLPYSITVYKYDLEGNYIESYKSISEAARNNNTLCSDIAEAVKGKKITIAGFQWRLSEIIEGIGKPREHRYNNKTIYQIDSINNNVVNIWKSASDASLKLNISRTGINNCLKHRVKTSSGYKWLFEKEAKELGFSKNRLDK